MILLWTEGKHAQVEINKWSVWVGLDLNRWMLGVVFNSDYNTLEIGLGPLYCGVWR